METALITWWTAVHILFGVGFGVLFWRFIKLKPLKSSAITLFLLILWEFFEYYALAGIEFGTELLRNRIADVIIGYVAYLITYFWLKKQKTFK